MTEQKTNRDILLFLGLTVALSCIFYGLIGISGHVTGGGTLYVQGLMWCPAMAAALTVLIRRLDPRTLALHRSGGRYNLLAYLLPLAYAALAYAAIWALGLGGFPDAAGLAAISAKLGWTIASPALTIVLYFVLLGSTGMITSMAHALGEEIGWRGFLAPRMAGRFGFTAGAILTGLIWAAWHMPLLLFSDYNGGTPWWYGVPCFTVMVVASSVMMTWIRLRSDSVWPCAVMHASHNLFIQKFFTPLTSARGDVTRYAVDEFGLALPVAAVLLALAIWLVHRRAGDHPSARPVAA